MSRGKSVGAALRAAGWQLFPWLALCLSSGCRSCDLVEAELRSRENESRELRSELFRSEAHAEALQREVCALRQGGAAGISPELANQTFTVKQIVFGRQTGGYDEDHCPGDEGLQVAVEPRDFDEHPIKAPGALQIQAAQITSSGVKLPLATWDVTPEQLRRTWKTGLLSSGYVVTLPWKKPPTSEKVRITARLTLTDGRVFEADKDVKVHLVPGAKDQPPVPGPPLEEINEPVLTAPQVRRPALWKPGAGIFELNGAGAAVAQGQAQPVLSTSLRRSPGNSDAAQLARPVPIQ